ncbi:MAG: peptide chain release factor N(5)-glutamine methyltransferase [Chitinivibrionales bacterium]
MKIKELLYKLSRDLVPVAQDLSGREAEQILEDVTGFDRQRLYRSATLELSERQLEKAFAHLKKRLTGTPLAYVLGYTYFWDQTFITTQAVLIPRPDTETVITQILHHENEPSRYVTDLGTGSGIIAQTLCGERPDWKLVAIDRSQDAVEVARQNCQASIMVVCSDMLQAFKRNPLFDIVVSNPPYIPDRHVMELNSSVRDYEPMEALAGGADGLDYYRYLAQELKDFLKDGARIYCEIGYDQGESVSFIFKDARWESVQVFKDLANRPRVVRAIYPGNSNNR